jgi:hypothetical protein
MDQKDKKKVIEFSRQIDNLNSKCVSYAVVINYTTRNFILRYSLKIGCNKSQQLKVKVAEEKS